MKWNGVRFAEGVTPFSLSHPMGEGRGEGKAPALFTCRFFPSGLRTSVCPRPVPDGCAEIPRGPKGGFGNDFDPGGWPDTNSVVNALKEVITWTCIVTKPNWRSNWMGQAMESLSIDIATSCAMPALLPEVFSLNGFGIISLPVGKIGRIWWRTSGNFCRSVLHIPGTWCRLLTAANPTGVRRKRPHPDPLPSDGRGKRNHALIQVGYH